MRENARKIIIFLLVIAGMVAACFGINVKTTVDGETVDPSDIIDILDETEPADTTVTEQDPEVQDTEDVVVPDNNDSVDPADTDVESDVEINEVPSDVADTVDDDIMAEED